jgi:DNA-binding Lrp family transcriptional regulator
MTFIDISRKLPFLKKTIIRRIEKLQAKGIIINFGITYNPSITKVYNYFSIMLWIQEESSTKVIENISYSDLNDHLLIRPDTHFKDIVILNFYSENVSDVISISERLRNLENVKEVQLFNLLK